MDAGEATAGMRAAGMTIPAPGPARAHAAGVNPPGEGGDPYCLREGEAARLLAAHPWRRFVVVGDSIAEGLGDPSPGYPDEPWCDRIARELRGEQPALSYLNLGVRNTPAAGVAATQLAAAMEFRPDLALVAVGGYDLLGFSYDADEVERTVRMVATAFAGLGADVITVGPFDASAAPGLPRAFGQRLRARLTDYARRTEAVAAEVGGVHVGLTSHPAAHDPDMYSADPRHGTMRGHAIAAAEAVRRLGAFLDAANRRTR